MRSTRLPGKVLMPLAGKPVLWHIIHRLRQSRAVDSIAIATSIHSVDDPIAAFAMQERIEIVRGPEDNLLARYALAAESLAADIIVRVTGDAPLIDPAMVDRLVKTLIEKEADYCMGDPTVPSIHEGFSPFNMQALEKLLSEAADNPVAREHVTGYFKMCPGFVRVAYVPIEPDYQFSGARISVDTPADFRFLEEIYARLKAAAGEADVRDMVRLLRTEPDLLEINTHVHRKGLHEPSRRVLFRCDGDAQIGLGHVYRCLALAAEMRDAQGFGVSFAMTTGSVGFDLVGQAGYPIDRNDGDGEEIWMDKVVQRLQPDALVLDVRSKLAPSKVQEWRENGVVIVTLDDPSERRLAADLAFYPPVPQTQHLSWADFTGQLYQGWDVVVLRREFGFRAPKVPNQRPVVLVTMGGSDPAGLTLKAIAALELLDEDFKTVVALGPGFFHQEALDAKLARTRREFEIHENVALMSGLMAEADLAVASFGITAYELASMGVPSIYLCLSQDHAESASAFVNAGMAVSLGEFGQVTEQELAYAVRRLMNDQVACLRLARLSKEHIDGQGAARVAQIVATHVKGKDE